jgi:putative hydrolases of HD superfamily
MNQLGNSDQKPILTLEFVAPTVYQSLQKLKRTGWVMRGVKDPESVKEHTEALILLARELTPLLLPAETTDLIEMLEIHDWPEVLHGDEVILELRNDERKALKAVKFANEQRALAQICAELPNGDEIMSLWLRFENSDDPAAVFGRQLDKYQALEKSLEYELAQGIPLFEEFLTFTVNFIHHPVLLHRIEELKSKWNSFKS